MLYHAGMSESTGTALHGSETRAEGVQRTRHQVVNAVRGLLIESGYHRLSLEQVAHDAGITRVTIYRHFGSKLGLLEAVADDLSVRGRAAERITAALELPDTSASLRALVHALCGFWSTDPPLFRRMVSLSAVDPEAREVLGARERWRYEGIATMAERLAAEGRLRPPFDTDQAAATIAAVTSFPACDQIATALAVDMHALPALLLPLLAGVARLE